MHELLASMAEVTLLGGFVASSLIGSAVTHSLRRRARCVTKRSSQRG